MKPETIERLLALNEAFYEQSAGAFSKSRGSPWPGWARLLDRFTSPLAVLDLGCGNGRFFAELSRRNLVRDYLGVDTSSALIEIARRLHPGASFEVGDAISVDARGFDLVVAFGLLHHLPSLRLRERFAASLRSHLTEGGIACVTFWRFEDRPRFRRKMVKWELDEREPGDHLLSFGEEGARYCHHASDEEIARLVAASGMSEIDRWSADGETKDLNLYSVLAVR